MFWIKQYIKMFLQNLLLPAVYFCFCRRPVRKGAVIFADGHHQEMPFSMRRVYEAVEKEKGTYRTELFIEDFGKLSLAENSRLSVSLYAKLRHGGVRLSLRLFSSGCGLQKAKGNDPGAALAFLRTYEKDRF